MSAYINPVIANVLGLGCAALVWLFGAGIICWIIMMLRDLFR